MLRVIQSWFFVKRHVCWFRCAFAYMQSGWIWERKRNQRTAQTKTIDETWFSRNVMWDVKMCVVCVCVRVFDVGREGVGLVMFDYLCWNNMKSYHTIRKRRIYRGCVPRCGNSSNSDTIRSEYRGLHICEKQDWASEILGKYEMGNWKLMFADVWTIFGIMIKGVRW